MTAPIAFTAAGVLLTHGPLTPLGVAPGAELIMALAVITLALVLFADASRIGLHHLRADLGLCLRPFGAKPVITVIAFTVLLSRIAHGLTANPLAKRYGPGSVSLLALWPLPDLARCPNAGSSAARPSSATNPIRQARPSRKGAAGPR
jgi:hypothetical protein